MFAQAKWVRVIKGRVLDIVVGLRKQSKTFGKLFSIELKGTNNKQLFVPRGFLHVFLVLENDTIVSYKCDNYYHPDVKHGVIFNDKNLNIDWKLGEDEI
jgi:dTDP-4-dehydrorhamnose 3,5-epimerase